MIENLETIYEGKATVIKNKQYLSAKDYISPFVDRLKSYTDKFICNVKIADQLSYSGNNTDTIYNKVLVTSVFPEEYNFTIDTTDYHRVVCMTYSLDTKTPICKFYTGVVDPEMNFFAFGGDCCSIQKIEPDTPIDYSSVQSIIEHGLKDVCQEMLEQIKNITLNKAIINTTLGDWIDFTIRKEYINDAGKVKLASNLAIETYKNLIIDAGSNYYWESSNIPYINIFRAYLNQISRDEKDIINRYEKTQLVNQLLNL